jgi:hypothetical protein
MKIQLNAATRLIAAGTTEEVSGPVTLEFSKLEPLKFKNAASFHSWSYSKKARDMGSMAHMRMGHYSIILFKYNDVGVAETYIDAGTYDDPEDIPPGSEFWESTVRDRMTQMKQVAAALKVSRHPMTTEVMKDINAEVKFYKNNS